MISLIVLTLKRSIISSKDGLFQLFIFKLLFLTLILKYFEIILTFSWNDRKIYINMITCMEMKSFMP